MTTQRGRVRRFRFGAAVVMAGGLAAAMALAGCGSDDTDSSGSDATTTSTTTTTAAAPGASSGDMDGHTYTSRSADGRQLVAGSTVTLAFADGRLAVTAGCNTISGAYTTDGGTLAFDGEPISTMMGCDEALMEQDQWLTTWLTAGVAVTATEQGITLDGDGVTMEFATSGSNDTASLIGPTWTLNELISGDSASSLPVGAKPATLVFVQGGEVNVFAGCNTGGTSVTTSGDTATFEPMRLTRMACEQAAMDVENAVTAVLDGDVTYELDGTTLTLTKGGTGLRFTAA
ncbi:hypothetical protein BH10ACT3_BH10ACT3_11360 [soil metagenome]